MLSSGGRDSCKASGGLTVPCWAAGGSEPAGASRRPLPPASKFQKGFLGEKTRRFLRASGSEPRRTQSKRRCAACLPGSRTCSTQCELSKSLLNAHGVKARERRCFLETRRSCLPQGPGHSLNGRKGIRRHDGLPTCELEMLMVPAHRLVVRITALTHEWPATSRDAT